MIDLEIAVQVDHWAVIPKEINEVIQIVEGDPSTLHDVILHKILIKYADGEIDPGQSLSGAFEIYDRVNEEDFAELVNEYQKVGLTSKYTKANNPQFLIRDKSALKSTVEETLATIVNGEPSNE